MKKTVKVKITPFVMIATTVMVMIVAVTANTTKKNKKNIVS